MSQRFVGWWGSACLVLLVPAAGWAQNKNCKPSGSSTSNSVGRTSSMQGSHCAPMRSSMQTPVTSSCQRNPNMPTGMRRVNQPMVGLTRQPNPQLDQAIQQHQQLQQGMLQQVHLQYALQDQKKQVLLAYALEAPTQNLQRELKNSDAFVRWAASVELNRRYKLEKAITPKAEPPVRTEVAAEAPRRRSADTPVVLTRIEAPLALQLGIPKD